MIYIATTTINKPTKALKLFAKNKNCKLIVALDKKSKKFDLKGSITLSTDYQEKKWPKLSKLIGWNCIQRRNFAILEAFDRGAEIIALIDDDNIPYKNWFKNIFVGKRIKCKEVSTNKDIFDPVGYTNHKNLWHRGLPLELVNNRKYKTKKKHILNQIFKLIFGMGTQILMLYVECYTNQNANLKKIFFLFFLTKFQCSILKTLYYIERL